MNNEFNFTVCPICNEKIIPFYYPEHPICCKNKCYSYSNAYSMFRDHTQFTYIKIFDETFCFNDDEKEEIENNKVKETISLSIEYWRENDRYLMELID